MEMRLSDVTASETSRDGDSPESTAMGKNQPPPGGSLSPVLLDLPREVGTVFACANFIFQKIPCRTYSVWASSLLHLLLRLTIIDLVQ